MSTRRHPRHDVLFEPVAIGPHVARNRFYQVPHCTGYGNEKPLAQAHHRGTKADGGWAVVSTEYCSISPESDEWPWVSARLWDAEDARQLRAMTDEAHRHGALAAVQLWHGGAQVECRESRLPTLAPGAYASAHEGWSVPKAMTVDDIARVQEDWVRAARLARDAGFDIVYVYGSHGYLPTQFLSSRLNRRTDAYGGPFAHRARFWLECIARVREAVGDDCAIAVRIAADTMELSGITAEEGMAFIRAADPHVDLWDLSVGAVAGTARLDSGPSRFFPQGYQLPWTAGLREATTKPIVGVGRYTDPDRMAAVVRSGVQDFIGAARPSIADPFLPAKVEAGRYAAIRECIGCNACYSRANWGRHLGCTQNPTAGEEHRRGWHPERLPPVRDGQRDALVVGAGPAGMECALVLARRGFRRVHVVDAAPEVGGCVRWIRRLPGLGEWGRVADWRRVSLQSTPGVEIVTGLRLDADAVRAYGGEVVVIATGSHWATDGRNGIDRGPIPGADATLPHVLTPEAVVLGGKRPPGERVAVLDHEGYVAGVGVAELLRREGHDVVLVTPYDRAAPLCDQTLEGIPLRAHLRRLGVRVLPETVPTAVDGTTVRLVDAWGEPSALEVDGVVLVTQRVVDDALHAALAADRGALEDAGIRVLVRAGDCVAPRLLADAIFDGHRVGREIEEPDPERALPYLRERAPVPAR